MVYSGLYAWLECDYGRFKNTEATSLDYGLWKVVTCQTAAHHEKSRRGIWSSVLTCDYIPQAVDQGICPR